jgi:hypothetical protein
MTIYETIADDMIIMIIPVENMSVDPMSDAVADAWFVIEQQKPTDGALDRL